MSLKDIREKNKEKSLLLHENSDEEYSEELIEQCKNEFKHFVKPMTEEFLKRYNPFVADKSFIEESNKNVITDEFLEQCKEASKLIKRDIMIRGETTLNEDGVNILISQIEQAKKVPKHKSNIDIEENMREGKGLFNEYSDKRKEED